MIAQPPYTPTFHHGDGLAGAVASWCCSSPSDNYLLLTQDSLYWKAYLSSSVRIAAISTAAWSFCIGYPIAYGMGARRRGGTAQPTLLMLVILPFWTSFLIRVYAWIGILKTRRACSTTLLIWLGLIHRAADASCTPTGRCYIGIVYSYLPFMVLPLYATLSRMDESLLEAAADLGCRPGKAFLTITLPLSMPGVIAGSMLVFIPAVGEFVIPDLLGGPNTLMIGKVLWTEFFSNKDWPVASAVAVATLLLLVVPIVRFQKAQEESTRKAEELAR